MRLSISLEVIILIILFQISSYSFLQASAFIILVSLENKYAKDSQHLTDILFKQILQSFV